jgi:PAS domain S-box-containing protein
MPGSFTTRTRPSESASPRLGPAIHHLPAAPFSAHAPEVARVHDRLRRQAAEHKRLETALEASQERLRQLADGIAETSWLWETDARHAPYTRALQERSWSGSTAPPWARGRWLDLVHPEDRARVRTSFAAKVLDGRYDEEYRVACRDGTLRWIRDRGVPVRNQDGDLHHIAGIASDVTERKEGEQRLATYERILECMGGGVHLSDATGIIAFTNPALDRMFGYDGGALVGRHIASLLDYPPAQNARVAREILGQLAACGTWEGELRTRRRDGTPFLTSARLSAIELAGTARLVGIYEDVTERKRLEEEARRHQAQLAHVLRLSTMGDMASGLAHELSQPLTAIVNYSMACVRQLRAGRGRRHELLEMMEEAAAEALRGGEIIHHLWDFVHKKEPRRETVDLHRVLRDVLRLMAAEAERYGIAMRLDPGAALPAVDVDRVQIEQVVVNLVRNAIESICHAESAIRELHVTTSVTAASVEVAVCDTGSGIAPDMADEVFAPFVSTKPNGLGMGLSISRSIVEAHGGRLWLTPGPQGGVCARFTLPHVVDGGGPDDD